MRPGRWQPRCGIVTLAPCCRPRRSSCCVARRCDVRDGQYPDRAGVRGPPAARPPRLPEAPLGSRTHGWRAGRGHHRRRADRPRRRLRAAAGEGRERRDLRPGRAGRHRLLDGLRPDAHAAHAQACQRPRPGHGGTDAAGLLRGAGRAPGLGGPAQDRPRGLAALPRLVRAGAGPAGPARARAPLHRPRSGGRPAAAALPHAGGRARGQGAQDGAGHRHGRHRRLVDPGALRRPAGGARVAHLRPCRFRGAEGPAHPGGGGGRQRLRQPRHGAGGRGGTGHDAGAPAPDAARQPLPLDGAGGLPRPVPRHAGPAEVADDAAHLRSQPAAAAGKLGPRGA